MNKMRPSRIRYAAVALFCALIAQAVAFTEPSRCQACTAVAVSHADPQRGIRLLLSHSPILLCLQAELKSRLAKEKPRNHLDMRHRLDSEGKRYGKTIDYM